MRQTVEVIGDWISRINAEATDLTDWEEQFMESVAKQFELRGFVSDKQAEVIERIYAQKTK